MNHTHTRRRGPLIAAAVLLAMCAPATAMPDLSSSAQNAKDRAHCQAVKRAANGAMLRRQRGQDRDEALQEMLSLARGSGLGQRDVESALDHAYRVERFDDRRTAWIAVLRARMQAFSTCQRTLLRQ